MRRRLLLILVILLAATGLAQVTATIEKVEPTIPTLTLSDIQNRLAQITFPLYAYDAGSNQDVPVCTAFIMRPATYIEGYEAPVEEFVVTAGHCLLGTILEISAHSKRVSPSLSVAGYRLLASQTIWIDAGLEVFPQDRCALNLCTGLYYPETGEAVAGEILYSLGFGDHGVLQYNRCVVTERDIYRHVKARCELRARPGDSGSPMMDADGNIVGILVGVEGHGIIATEPRNVFITSMEDAQKFFIGPVPEWDSPRHIAPESP